MFTKFAIKNTIITQLLAIILIPLNVFVFFSALTKAFSFNNLALTFIISAIGFALLFVPLFLIVFLLSRKLSEEFVEKNTKKITVLYVLNILGYILINISGIIMVLMKM